MFLLTFFCQTLITVTFFNYVNYKIIITLIIVSIFIILSCFIVGYRWKIIIATMGENLPILFASKNVFIGMFFNQFLPSTFGGDFYRIFLIKKYGISLTVASFK